MALTYNELHALTAAAARTLGTGWDVPDELQQPGTLNPRVTMHSPEGDRYLLSQPWPLGRDGRVEVCAVWSHFSQRPGQYSGFAAPGPSTFAVGCGVRGVIGGVRRIHSDGLVEYRNECHRLSMIFDRWQRHARAHVMRVVGDGQYTMQALTGDGATGEFSHLAAHPDVPATWSLHRQSAARVGKAGWGVDLRHLTEDAAREVLRYAQRLHDQSAGDLTPDEG